MSLTAIVREVSPNINRCELSFHVRQKIDVAKAIVQHKAYQDLLRQLGARILCLPAAPDFPDAVFVEDAAVVTDEIAIITRMGAPSRRAETHSLTEPLSRYRPLTFLVDPATLDGGDVMRTGYTFFVGLSQRTNEEGIAQLRKILRTHGYQVHPVAIRGCLHLKSACSFLGHNTLLINRTWIDSGQLSGFEFIDVPADEPGAANALLIRDSVLISAAFPKTRDLLEKRGFRVQTIDLSELEKAEAGATCTSLIFKDQTGD